MLVVKINKIFVMRNYSVLLPVVLALVLFAGCENGSFYYSATGRTTSFVIANNIDDPIRVVYASDPDTDDSTVYIPARKRNDVSVYYDTTLGSDIRFTVYWGSRLRVYSVPYGTEYVTIYEDDFR